jgi:hypothetical protein
MSVDTNKLDITSDSNSFTIKLSIDSMYSSSFDSYLDSLYNVGRKGIIKSTLFDSQKAVLCFSRSSLMLAYNDYVDQLDVKLFYPFQNQYIVSLKEANLSIITNQSLFHSISQSPDVDSSSFKFNLINDQLITPSLNNLDTDLIVYSFSPSYIGNYQKVSVPEPLCNFYSNPLANHFSSYYNYANNANTPCCSNSKLTKDLDTVFACGFSCHSECSYYSPQNVVVESLTSIDKINSNETFLFELTKSHYSDFTVHYSVTNNGVSSFNTTYSLDSNTTEDDIDSEMKIIFHSIVDDFSHSKEPSTTSVNVPTKRSFISTIVKL